MYSAMRGRAHAAGSLASLTELCQSGDSLAQNRQAVEAGGQPQPDGAPQPGVLPHPNVLPRLNNLPQPDVLPTDSLVRALVLAKLDGAGSEELAYEFHRGLAQMIVRAGNSFAQRKNGREDGGSDRGRFPEPAPSGACGERASGRKDSGAAPPSGSPE